MAGFLFRLKIPHCYAKDGHGSGQQAIECRLLAKDENWKKPAMVYRPSTEYETGRSRRSLECCHWKMKMGGMDNGALPLNRR